VPLLDPHFDSSSKVPLVGAAGLNVIRMANTFRGLPT